MIEKHYTPGEVAERLSLPRKTVTNYLRRGVLHGVKAGWQWRIPESSLERFLEEGREAGKNPGPLKDHFGGSD